MLDGILHLGLVYLEIYREVLEDLVGADVVLDEVRSQLLLIHYSSVHLEVFLEELASRDFLVVHR